MREDATPAPAGHAWHDEGSLTFLEQWCERETFEEHLHYSREVQNTGSDPFTPAKQAQQTAAPQVGGFRKTFSACLEADKRMVRIERERAP